MLYVRCPTCRSLLASKQILYENMLNDICNDQQLSDSEKNLKKRKVLDELYITRECCRMRVLTYLRLIDLIK
jgi:DNA-directed RNA polymerase subunit N (RpoN/RPB10)